MTWAGKPCARCEGKKGPQYANGKYCGRCAVQVRKEAKTKRHDSHVSRVYGITPEEYERIYVYQNGRCAICLRATGRTRRLSVDHNHATLAVRGLLCRVCNDLLGHGRDDPLFFARVIHYLGSPPAPVALGRVVRVPSLPPTLDLGSTARTAGWVTP